MKSQLAYTPQPSSFKVPSQDSDFTHDSETDIRVHKLLPSQSSEEEVKITPPDKGGVKSGMMRSATSIQSH